MFAHNQTEILVFIDHLRHISQVELFMMHTKNNKHCTLAKCADHTQIPHTPHHSYLLSQLYIHQRHESAIMDWGWGWRCDALPFLRIFRKTTLAANRASSALYKQIIDSIGVKTRSRG